MRTSHSSESQYEKRARGEAFQNEIKASWRLIPDCWRMRISDDCGSRPADEIVLLSEDRLLNELKRKADGMLCISDLRTNQLGGLIDFMHAGGNNFGMVLVSFVDDTYDTAYAIAISTFLNLCERKNRMYLSIKEISDAVYEGLAVEIPRLASCQEKEKFLVDVYDLRPLVKFIEGREWLRR